MITGVQGVGLTKGSDINFLQAVHTQQRHMPFFRRNKSTAHNDGTTNSPAKVPHGRSAAQPAQQPAASGDDAPDLDLAAAESAMARASNAVQAWVMQGNDALATSSGVLQFMFLLYFGSSALRSHATSFT